MTVRELIDMLSKVPQDSMVVIPGYEGGFDNPTVESAALIPDTNWNGKNKNYWYSGRHDEYFEDVENSRSFGGEAPISTPIQCVVIGRG